ncbi:outer membrane efflux lipoprotein [Edaphobacter dinghuensis]|uniref:Outer membrane efflux lipoprotein n=1 Tax=Edaphobacter dinghuensis TaxID=1560005 RepID=A0A917H6I2_9BACT|nr:outer membrane efflux lipoprotein [Edaphobacter dinghuensis]
MGPNYHRPSVPMAPAFSQVTSPPNPLNGGWKQAQPEDTALRGKWWEIYQDSQLNQLEEKITISNQTLKAAMDEYFQAREQVRVARSNYYPTVSAGPSVSRTRESYNQPNTQRSVTKYQYNTFTLEGQALWEPDLWGQVRRTVEQARANAQASAADLANVELSIRSELATDYFEMRGLDTQQVLFDRTVSDYTDYYNLTKIRFKGGVATDVDVAEAETQLRTTRAQAIDIAVARSQYEHAIATLVGVTASSFSLPAMPLRLRLSDIPSSVPSALLERRPDIAAAERRTAAANAQIGVAISAYYPTISLNGVGGFESTNPGTWIQGPSALWGLGGSALETLFDAGRRHAITQQTRDAYDMQVANYRQTVLVAFQEVEDNLVALRVLNEEATVESAAVDSAKRSLLLSTKRYKGGVTTYLEVLSAQTAQLNNERTSADITTRQFVASVALIKALGGGWNTTQLPNP